ncbi:MAG: hypothetical protein AB9835_11800 [Eubacteriales bacterium]
MRWTQAHPCPDVFAYHPRTPSPSGLTLFLCPAEGEGAYEKDVALRATPLDASSKMLYIIY